MGSVRTQEEHWDYTLNEWNNEYYFRDIINILKENKIETFIDIGANVGGVAQILLEKIPTIKNGYLFEPQKDNFNFLFLKFKDKKEILLLNCGIFYGIKYYNALQYFETPHVGGYTVIKDEHTSNTEKYKHTGEIFQLFELEFFNFPAIDFVKIDIEGAEYNLIENSSLLQKVKFIDIELHRGFDENYFKTNFPNHDIIYYGMFNDTVIHILLKLR